MKRSSLVLTGALALAGLQAQAQVVPFTETFDNDNAGFEAIIEGSNADFVSDDGSGVSGFIQVEIPTGLPAGMGSATVIAAETFGANVLGTDEEGEAVLTNPPASGGVLFGDFISSGITGVSFDVRHDADVDLVFSLRFANGITNFPGGFPSAVQNAVVSASDDFETITFDISSLAVTGFEGPPTPASFQEVFSNVGNIQITLTSESLGALGSPALLDLDNFTLIPEPTSLALLSFGGMLMLKRRKNA